jgi:D-sedoheptulose 7-phosphate isomerase
MQDPIELIDRFVTESIRVKKEFFELYGARVAETAQLLAQALAQGNKILLFGNGGSAADAQHIAAEFVGRFMPDRMALPAMSLSTDTSILTALGNDYGYHMIFSRQIEAHGRAGDVAIGISTSGNSPNVLAAFDVARERDLRTIGFTGESGGKMVDRADIVFRVPCRITPRIQETHLTLGHVLCELVDRQLFPEAYAQE